MSEVTRIPDWGNLSYEVRLLLNGPTIMVYNISNLPPTDDPGWASWKKLNSTQVDRLINIHGPFAIEGHEDSERCEDGWLGVNDSGFIFAVVSEYVKPSDLSSEIDERARPFGYREIA